jgi:fatty-acyl-CoA synthase
LLELFKLPDAFEVIEKGRVWNFPCVPTMMVSALDHPDRKKYDLSSLKAVQIAASPAPVELWRRVVEAFNLDDVVTGYGQTETAGGCTITPPDLPLELLPICVGETRMGGITASHRPYYKGRVVEYKIVNPITGEDLPEGSEGELACRGPVVMRNYCKNWEETTKLIDKDGWLRSGDLGRIENVATTHGDISAEIQLTGRTKELYIMGGENVAPLEVEYAISKHPKVRQVYICGVPDLKMSEVGAAYIQLMTDVECTEKEIIDFCKDRIASFKIPKYIKFVDASEIPLTLSGKVQKFKLRERAIKEYGLEEASKQFESMKSMGQEKKE